MRPSSWNRLEAQRDYIAETDHDEDTVRRLKDARRSRDRLILELVASGASERKVARAAGVTRGWIWRLKHSRES